MNIYGKISSKKLGFPTHLFQKTKLESVISSIIASPFHLRNLFSFIFVIGPNGYNLDPLNLFWDVLCIRKQIAFSWASKTNDQWVFSIKSKQTAFL
jgi:hypothetical protein